MRLKLTPRMNRDYEVLEGVTSGITLLPLGASCSLPGESLLAAMGKNDISTKSGSGEVGLTSDASRKKIRVIS